MKKVELLVPVKDELTFQAAIENGADAIYLGGKQFSARAYATNFELDEIVSIIKRAHLRQVLVYIAVNTVVFEKEMDELIAFLDALYLADADAFIVQDLGLIRWIKHRYPRMKLHVSTQQNVHCLDQVRFFEKLKVDRIILAREVELSLLNEICKNTKMEIEVFVHGALCVNYSGNCLHSSIVGKRSGNRGKCAQPCRMEYTLFENNHPISQKKYFLSMKDLNTLDYLDKIIKTGVVSLKVEGRMKSPEYVALITKSYKDAIKQCQSTGKVKVEPSISESMELLFNRPFTKGYLNHEQNHQITETFRPNHIGKKIGKVIDVNSRTIRIKLEKSIEQKDKIVILQKEDVSFYLSKFYVKGKIASKAYPNEIIELEAHSKIAKGSPVYQCLNAKQIETIQETYSKVYRKIPISMQLYAGINQPLKLTVMDRNKHMVVVNSEQVIEMAHTSPTSDDKVKEQLLKLGDTVYSCDDIQIDLNGELMIPVKVINDLRRNAIVKLNELRYNIHHRRESDIVMDYPMVNVDNNRARQLKLAVKVHTLEQLEALKDMDIDYIYYDDDITFTAASKLLNRKIIPVLSRIYHANENVRSDTYMINQLGDLIRHQHANMISDIYLNVTNSYAVNALIEQGIQHIGLSPELSKDLIQELIYKVRLHHKKIPTFEMMVYGRLQNMIMKHCFIAKELGFEKKHCGSCKKNQYSLVDRMNYQFIIRSDQDCNLTLYNSKRLHLIDELDNIFKMGVEVVRLDFIDENKKMVQEVVQLYYDAIHHKINNTMLEEVTYGHYFENELK